VRQIGRILRAALSTVSLALTACSVASAQDTTPIVTDRPDVTESAIVVPQWRVQAENGLTWTLLDGQHTVSGTESLLRLGIGQRFELRFGLPDYFLNVSPGSRPHGFSDSSLGFKQQLGPLPGRIELSVIMATSFPTGTSGVTTHGVDPFVKLPWSRDLQSGWSVGGMQSFFWTTENERRNPTWESTFYVEKEVTEPWAVFVEYAGDYSHFDSPRQLMHVGTMYRVGRHHQLDVHVGFGLATSASNHFVALGYSFRLDPGK
jgi:hypothetical protein